MKGRKKKQMNEQDIDRSSNLITALITMAVFVAVLLLVVVIVLNATGDAYDDYAGDVTTTVTVTNETGAWLNSSGYTLDSVATGNSDYTITAIYNTTDDVVISLANATVSTEGVVTNATVEWTGVYLSYTYTDDITDDTSLNTAYDGIQDDILSMVSNFFDIMPTIGTILAVVILIAVIVILVIYVGKMREPTASNTFSG